MKAETPGEPRGDQAKVGKNKPPGTLMETLSSRMRCGGGRSRRLAETRGRNGGCGGAGTAHQAICRQSREVRGTRKDRGVTKRMSSPGNNKG